MKRLDIDDTNAPPCYVEAWRDLDLKRRPHLLTAGHAPSYISPLHPKVQGAPPTRSMPIDLSPATLAAGRKSNLAKKRGRPAKQREHQA